LDAIRRAMQSGVSADFEGKTTLEAERDAARAKWGLAKLDRTPKAKPAPVAKSRAQIVRERLEKIGETPAVLEARKAEKEYLDYLDNEYKNLAADSGKKVFTSPEEINAWNQRASQVYSKAKELQERYKATSQVVSEEYVQALAVDRPTRFEPTYEKVSAKKQALFNQTLEQIGRVVSLNKIFIDGNGYPEGLTGMAVTIHGGGGRRANYTSGTVNIKDGGPKTLAHEMGHYLEGRSGVVKREDSTSDRLVLAIKVSGARLAREFRDRRAAGEYPSHIKNCGKDERGYKDKFLDHYMGKVYQSGDTEIVSMGLQYLVSDPIRLMKADPEYFDFIINMLQD